MSGVGGGFANISSAIDNPEAVLERCRLGVGGEVPGGEVGTAPGNLSLAGSIKEK